MGLEGFWAWMGATEKVERAEGHEGEAAETEEEGKGVEELEP
jgi:hypothetical protein